MNGTLKQNHFLREKGNDGSIYHAPDERSSSSQLQHVCFSYTSSRKLCLLSHLKSYFKDEQIIVFVLIGLFSRKFIGYKANILHIYCLSMHGILDVLNFMLVRL